jgi:hypothetical protein
MADTMHPEILPADRGLFVSWLLASFAGWLLGLVLILTAALLGDMLGFGGSQFIIGAGMGTGIGYMQGRILQHLSGAAGPWLWASLMGMGAPFLVSDLLTWAGLPFPLPLSVGAGGLLAGFLQRRILASLTPRANWWIPASFAGWILAAGMVAISSVLTGVLAGFYGTLINLVLILLGGVVLGAVTGGALIWISSGGSGER